MNSGDVLITAGTIAVLGAAIARVLAMRSGDKRFINLSVVLSLGTFLAVTSALLLLTYYFMSSNMDNYYVWNYSSTNLDSIYKLSGVWAGAQGSFLLWIWFMVLVLLVEVVLETRRTYLSQTFHNIFQVSLSGLIFVFMLILMGMSLFSATPSGALSVYPNGRGMELVLQTPEMVFHPPVVFAGYAFAVAAIAGSVAFFFSKDPNWFTVVLPWGRLSWIFLTLGIGIGAIWAYYVLGWGGYWAWDPVETSSLLPWIIMTAFLHTQVRHARNGEYAVASPTLGMLSFVSVLFATFATRAGSIWGSSAHAFLPGGAGASLLDILRDDSTVLGVFSLMLALLAASLYLMYWKLSTRAPQEEEPEPSKLSGYLNDKNNMTLTVLLFVMMSGIMLLLLFKNAGSTASVNFNEFTQKMSFFFVGIMVVMSICLVWRYLGQDLGLWLGLSVIIASCVMGAAAAFSGSFNWLVAFSLPSYVVATGASGLRLARSWVPRSIRKTLQNVGPHLIHLGIALVLLGYVVSSNMQVQPSNLADQEGVPGTNMDLGDHLVVGAYNITLVSLRQWAVPGVVGGADMIKTEAKFNISKSGRSVETGVALTTTYTWSVQGYQPSEVEVHIYKAIQNDLYMNFQWVNSTRAFVQAKTVPLMNVLWGGFGLLVVGLVMRTVAWKMEPKENPALKRSRGKLGKSKKGIDALEKRPANGAKDYEAQVEEELRKFKKKKSGQ